MITFSYKSIEDKRVEFDCYPLTKAGKELLAIVKKSYSDEFILDIGHFLKKKFKKIKVEAFKIGEYNSKYLSSIGEDLLKNKD